MTMKLSVVILKYSNIIVTQILLELLFNLEESKRV